LTKIQKQIKFFDRIKDLIPSNTSMVIELAELLNLSTDSMYRRIRGETSLTFDEIGALCNHFKISFDSFINLESGNVTFNYTLMEEGELSFKKYLISTRDDLKIIKSSPNPLITYACEDIPIFHNINFIDIASFKMMYWMKAILNVPELNGVQFSSNAVSQELKDLGQEIYQLYCSIPSIEIWTETTILSTIKQIEFFWEAGMFKTNNDAVHVLKALSETIKTIQKQAGEGSKIIDRNKEQDEHNNYNMYFSEIEITNNCVYVEMGSVQAVYLGHLTFNTMNTSNATYCRQTHSWMENLIRKSTLISKVAEKNRYQFFQGMHNTIDSFIEKIENT